MVLVIASVAAGDLVWPRSANAATVARTATFGPGKFGPLVVPSNLVEIRFDARGGSGGAGDGGNPCCAGGSGGLGGQITATVRYGHGVKAGDSLMIVAGRSGASSAGSAIDPRLTGGAGGAGTSGYSDGGGRGGDASGVYDETTRRWLVVAGGGGGGGGATLFTAGAKGGDGGAWGETRTAGGAGGGPGSPCPFSGASPSPGDGGSSSSSSSLGGAGGGGGGGCHGARGGGAGFYGTAGGGGGGGTSFTFSDALDARRGLAPAGDGSVTVTLDVYYEAPPEIVSPDRFDLTVGQPVTADFVSVGKPPPEIHVSGAFPPGVTFRIPLFSGIGEIRGTPTEAGVFTIHLTARNDWGSVTQDLKLDVRP